MLVYRKENEFTQQHMSRFSSPDVGGPSSASSTDHSLLHPFSAHATHALRMKPRENQRKIMLCQTALWMIVVPDVFMRCLFCFLQNFCQNMEHTINIPWNFSFLRFSHKSPQDRTASLCSLLVLHPADPRSAEFPRIPESSRESGGCWSGSHGKSWRSISCTLWIWLT